MYTKYILYVLLRIHVKIYIYLVMRETFSMKNVLNYCIDLYYNKNALFQSIISLLYFIIKIKVMLNLLSLYLYGFMLLSCYYYVL